MEAKPYPIEKRRILIERSQTDFVTFLQQVTDPQGRNFIRNQLLQRRVPGFREGRAPLERTVPQLIHRLRQEQELTNPDSAIWDLFTKAWMYWVKSHSELDDALTTFNNGADFDDNNQGIRPPNSELDIEYFRVLLEASLNNQIDQETIRNFYEYGYFKRDAHIENLIDQALPRQNIEQRLQIEQLPDQVDSIRREINELRSQIPDLETVKELEQILDQRMANAQQSFENQISELSHQISALQQSFRKQVPESNFTQTISLLKQLIASLESQIVEVEVSLSETQSVTTESINAIDRQITELVQQIQDTNRSVEDGLASVNSNISEIQLTVEEQNQQPDIQQAAYEALRIGERYAAAPRIAHQALEIGEKHKNNLNERTERYEDENDYLENFRHCLRRFGVTDSEETSAAIHIALKTFPAIEIPDAQIMRVWCLICGYHQYYTTINVEMGWLGLQDWFPNLFADQCFGERLERINLDISIRKMLKLGDMPWIIHFRDCDMSYPECYLPCFLDWLGRFSEGSIKVFLTRCRWMNRCETNEDIYARVARLPKPDNPEPLEPQNLKPQDVVTRTEWESWCKPDPDTNSQYEPYHGFLNQLRNSIENENVQIPLEIPREILHYLKLSRNILAEKKAFDWALTLRLLPWIGNRHRLIDVVQNLVGNQELPHFQEGLQMTREAEE